MTRQISLFFIGIVTVLYSYSQTKNHTTSLSLSIGAAVPVGHFSSTDMSNRLSGYAKAGETISFSLSHRISKQLGLVATLYGQRNGLNTNSLAGQFSETSIPFYYNGGGPNSYPNWTFARKSWYIGSFLVGLTDELFSKSESKISFRVKAQIGVADVQLPTLNGSSITDTSFVIVSQNSASAFGISYLADIGGRYKFDKQFCLIFSLSYFGTTRMNFKNITESLAATNGGLNIPGIYALNNSKLPPQTLSATSDYKQPIGAININFGIGLHL